VEKVNFIGIMESTMKENGKMVKNMGMDFGNQIMVKVLLASGVMEKQQGMEYT
jgi:hypothetical protein